MVIPYHSHHSKVPADNNIFTDSGDLIDLDSGKILKAGEPTPEACALRDLFNFPKPMHPRIPLIPVSLIERESLQSTQLLHSFSCTAVGCADGGLEGRGSGIQRFVPHIASTLSSSSNTSLNVSDPHTELTDTKNSSRVRVKRTRSYSAPEKLTRKRSLNPSQWKSKSAKLAQNQGLEHLAADGSTFKSARELGPSCGPGCRFKCENKLKQDDRQAIFSQFWAIGDHARQWDFIIRHVLVNDKSANFENETRRKKSRQYLFKVNGVDIFVCKSMFIQTLAITDKWIESALKKVKSGDAVPIDNRGKSKLIRYHALKLELKKSIVDHINLFPRVDSHYTRKDSKRQYLEENLSVPQMHKYYLEWVKDQGIDPATERQYRDVFNTEFNIGFFKPKKDLCDVCVAYENSNEDEKLKKKEQYEIHLVNKERAKALKETDAMEAKKEENTSLSVSCFDLQKVLQTPQGNCSLFYYRRKHSVYNFTIYDIGPHEGYCYLWTENIGKKGPNEIASFVMDYIEKKSSNGVKRFIFYSDNCPGQNRNRIVFSMYELAAIRFDVEIIHRFLERGHTQNEGDSMHALIENRSAGKAIYHPDQWQEIIETAKGKNAQGGEYVVTKVSQEMIFDFKPLLKKQQWICDVDKRKILWSKVKEIFVEPSAPNFLKFKTNFDEDYQTVYVAKRSQPLDLKTHQLHRAYSDYLGISESKLTDLLFLCSKNAIPEAYHSYYGSLKSSSESSSKSKSKVAGRTQRTLQTSDNEGESDTD